MTVTTDPMPAAPVEVARFTTALDQELAGLPDEIDRVIGYETGPLTGVSKYLFKSRGKLIRPALLFACAATGPRGCAAWSMQTRRLASAVEILHVATLYHDDVIDAADTRRGIPSVNAQHGVTLSVLAGDFLITKAIAVANDAGQRFGDRVLATLKELCIGQSVEFADIGNVDRTLDDYYACITAKTGSLFALACELGGASGSMVDSDVAGLRSYGEHLGIAFQIADDLLDLLSSTTATGKPVLNDMAEGNHTLPTILALEADPGLCELLTLVPAKPELRPQIVERIRATDALQRTRACIDVHVRTALDHLPHSALTPESEFLRQLPARAVGSILMPAATSLAAR